MMRSLLVFCSLLVSVVSMSQSSHRDSILDYQHDYVRTHGAVKGKDREYIHFFKPDSLYRVKARFERIYEAPWFAMSTSGQKKKIHRVYGLLHFTIRDTVMKLYVYQAQDLMQNPEYADYLFIPFTDLTSAGDSYENGRYIDLKFADVETGTLLLDFNKAYNPYCAYVTNVYNCPIPPPENSLSIEIRAGEMKYGKTH